MRHRNVWAAGLALGLGLCMVGIALGQEPAVDGGGNWFSRLFTRSAAPTAARTDEKKDEKIVPVVPRTSRRAQALADYLRYMAACDKLREIAFETNDDELKNRADVLEMRAKDIYVQRTNPGAGASVDELALERQLMPMGKNLTPLTTTAGRSGNGGMGQASAEGR